MIKTVVVYLLIVTGVQTKQLCNNRNVTVMEGQSATLRCNTSEDAKIALVEWKKSSNKTRLAVYSSNSTYYNVERIKMEVNHHCSTISIEETLKSDEDWYFCIFQTFPNGKQDCKIYLEVKEEEKFQASSYLVIYIVISVVLAVLVIGMILLLIRYVHLRKSRVNIPNQINIILKITDDTDNQDSKLQLNRPMVTNNQCEDTGIDYNYMSVSLQ
ncbi:T-cell immunoreceptor with Ig and ITIM domains-like [Rhincodon typus]|uniref:T-cell immunoreceptor with Ig and ITIM domains-like n=1 Tax=Rhincodon typus TaxID=259920 RepID=UPI00202E8EFD|nr:T-cell immunoreceptor with Ig and ITIM domains-like [Rhincodon typus]